jgi:xanthine dehydrogenase accessory factor
MKFENLVVFRGGGELASGAIRKLALAGFPVVILETEKPSCVRRTVAFANCVYEGNWDVEGVKGRLYGGVNELNESREFESSKEVSVIIDPEGRSIPELRPRFLVDGRMVKKNLGTKSLQAEIVIALGPGFHSPEDAHFVIETARGHDLGRVIFRGSAKENTHIPGEIGGSTKDRVLRAGCDGMFQSDWEIGDRAQINEIVGRVNGESVSAKVDGVIRGLLKNGLEVRTGQKLGDIDPRGDSSYIHRVSDKANAIGGGVLEAVLRAIHRRDTEDAEHTK